MSVQLSGVGFTCRRRLLYTLVLTKIAQTRGKTRLRVQKRVEVMSVGLEDGQYVDHEEKNASAIAEVVGLSFDRGTRTIRIGSVVYSPALPTAAPSMSNRAIVWPSPPTSTSTRTAFCLVIRTSPLIRPILAHHSTHLGLSGLRSSRCRTVIYTKM